MIRFSRPLLLAVALLPACAVGPAERAGRTQAQAVPHAHPLPGAAQRSQFQQAMALLEAGDAGAALRALQTLQEQHGNIPGVATNLGILLHKKQDLVGARMQFERATAQNRGNIAAWNWLAVTHRKLGEKRAAEQALLSALGQAPQDPATHCNLAILYDLHLNQPEAALEHYRKYQALSAATSPIVEAWIRRLDDATRQALTAEVSP